jgi:hypothetical protein
MVLQSIYIAENLYMSVSVQDAKKEADRQITEDLKQVFSAAALPYLQRNLKNDVGNRVADDLTWGLLFFLVGSAADRFVPDQRTQSKELAKNFGWALASSWLAAVKKSSISGSGCVNQQDVIPAGFHLREIRRQVGDFMDPLDVSNIDVTTVLYDGLEELAQNSGDIILPNNLKIERQVLDSVLARRPA